MEYNQEANTCPIPKGILVVIGGKEDKGDKKEEKNEVREEILKTFISLIEKENPRIEIITSASSEGKEMFNDYKKVFSGLKAKNLGHIHHIERREVLNDELTERVKQADAFFFTGGDQLLLTSLYGGSKFLTQLKERYIYEKIVIGGTSAGAMALSTPMIYAGNKDEQDITGEIKIAMGLEFLKDVCIDTHFIDRDRFVRMAQVIATNPTSIGLGIEEDTALIIRNGVEAEVIGNSIITVIEGFEISSSNITDYNADQKLTLRDLRVHLLAKPSKYYIQQINPPHK
ncbi:MAG TPA: cyanophycinase [Parafilimonas sp.]|nr:cyanophycinase [Parafilimonas sp.]